MVTIKSDLMNVLEGAVNNCSEWRQRCETCANLESCISSWTIGANDSVSDCLTSKELEQYVEKFFQFMDARMKGCQGLHSN